MGVRSSKIFKGTIFIYLLFSSDHLYHSLWSKVKERNDFVLKAYCDCVGNFPVLGLGQGLTGVEVQISL